MSDLVAQVPWAALDSSPGKGSPAAAPGLQWVLLAFIPLLATLETKALPAIGTHSHYEIKSLANFAAV